MTQRNTDSNEESSPLAALSLLAKKRLYQSYSKVSTSYNNLMLNALLTNGKCHLVAVFKDSLINDDVSEFFKRNYKIFESPRRIKKLVTFYTTTSVIFPNYTPLPEAKYIYKNVMHKQKLIDQQQENEDIEKYMKKHRRVQNDSDKVFDSEAYDEIINQSNSVVITMLGMSKKDDDEYDKIQNLIDMIKTSEFSIDTMSSSPPKQNVTKTKIIIDDKIRFKLKLDQINKGKVNISNITSNNSNKQILSLSLKSNSPIKPLKQLQTSRNNKINSNQSLKNLSSSHQSKLKHHHNTLSMPKISIKRTPKIKNKFKVLVDNSNMLKTLSTAAMTSPSIQHPETTARLHIKTKSIFTLTNNILECHPKNLANRFRSPPVTERGTKSKKMFHIQNMEQIAKNIKNKFLHGKPMKGNDNVNTLAERQFMY